MNQRKSNLHNTATCVDVEAVANCLQRWVNFGQAGILTPLNFYALFLKHNDKYATCTFCNEELRKRWLLNISTIQFGQEELLTKVLL